MQNVQHDLAHRFALMSHVTPVPSFLCRILLPLVDLVGHGWTLQAKIPCVHVLAAWKKHTLAWNKHVQGRFV